MLSLEKEASPVLTRFQEFMEYEDILFHLLRVLGKTFKTQSTIDEKFLRNLIYLLEHITLHDSPSSKEEEKPKLYCSSKEMIIYSNASNF